MVDEPALHKAYYLIKPILPRRVQLVLRRLRVNRILPGCGDRWPVDAAAAAVPENWPGWPDGKDFTLSLTHDVEDKRGHDRCRQLMDIEEDLGFRSCFYLVPERYEVSPSLRREMVERGFEVGVHGLNHDGKLYNSRGIFQKRAKKINHYLKEWGVTGFRSPSMQRNLDWIGDLEIEYDSSTFDTDPFEPNPEGAGTIYPFLYNVNGAERNYIELPYTLPQDLTIFVVMKNRDNSIWKKKLDWIAGKKGVAHVLTHPDYMAPHGASPAIDEYPLDLYVEFLEYVKERYAGRYWEVLPRDLARYWREKVVGEDRS